MNKDEYKNNNNIMLTVIKKQLDQMSEMMEKMKIADYVELMQSPYRLLWLNFIGGVARGFGIAVGFTILGAIVLYILQKLVMLNLPLIGSIIADIVKIVNQKLY
ncbi:hypothetical protein SAMN02745195_01351 [Thermoanaerobacter uzonensis DSM 18761]|uniref:Uncharacterized protein n=1 Tax=Thermoanaerobacter uzonensis DSM 18761 TaxID=1123369 RepID=A0A1M4WZB9_9THEO|nr:DUF5665 domain-containing protein [Thermoanaerobacter uzonensis]SHE86545.1 hypothetical protein SAMN02745195_01351 [Thermoanaerobacter uzonensis DSM 18761]